MHVLTDVTISQDSVSDIWNRISGMSLMGVVKMIVLVVVLLIVIKLVNNLVAKMLEKSKVDKTIHGFLKAAVKVLCYVVAVMIVAGSLGINTSSLIALLSVVGLALSLAVQGALANLAGGIAILVTRPFKVGDYVAVGAHEGFVTEINMTYTKLRTHEHLDIAIPNSNVTGTDVVNYSTEGRRRVDLVVCTDYGCPIDSAKEALSAAILAVPQLADTEEVFTRISGYRDNGIEYTLRAWCKNEDYWDAYFGLIESVKRSFDEKGVQMSYPNINVHVTQK